MCCAPLAGNAGPRKSPSGHHRSTLSGYIFVTKACIDNRKKTVKQRYILHMFPQYGDLWPTNGWDRFTSFGNPSKFQPVLRLDSVTARHSSSGRQPNFAALNRRRHLYSAGRPSRWPTFLVLVYIPFRNTRLRDADRDRSSSWTDLLILCNRNQIHVNAEINRHSCAC